MNLPCAYEFSVNCYKTVCCKNHIFAYVVDVRNGLDVEI